ncbi:MAG: PQQ-like beta-propeller repeat protein [Phycisphaerales bacterium]|nr:MAG: PQQ-like beta-propeller repeat protein [Phycisphaerales bacterium]
MKRAILFLNLWLFAAVCPIETPIFGNDVRQPKPVWESLGGDFRRTGLGEHEGPESGCVKWEFETGGAVPSSVTVGHDGRVHIACEDGKLYALDTKGSLLWSYDANSPLVSSPTIGPDGSVYVGSEEGALHAVDTNGNVRWTYPTAGPVSSSPAVSSDGNNIYAGSQDGTLYALAQDSSELWTFQTTGPGAVPTGAIFASPAIGADGTVYVGGLYDPTLYALDPNNGEVKWACGFESEGWPFTSPVVAQDGTIYQTLLFDTNLYAIEPADGTIIWSTDLADPCTAWFASDYADWYTVDSWSEPALGPDGTIYVSLDDPYLRAVEPNGNIKWVAPLGTIGGFTLAVGSNGLIYAASDDGYLRVVEPNGAEGNQFRGEAWLNFPVIAADNVIVVSDAKDNTVLITDQKNKVWAISQHGCEDINADETVDFLDLALLADDWLDCTDTGWPCNYEGPEQYVTTDIDRDQYVRFPDVAAMANRWLADVGWLGPPPCQAGNPNPPDGATGVSPYPQLSWRACPDTSWQEVYLGTSKILVGTATETTRGIYRQRQPRVLTEYVPAEVPLEGEETYYWRIDQISSAGTSVGKVWSFKVMPLR